MSAKDVKKELKNLEDNDKKKRQKACENLEAMNFDDVDLLKQAVNALERATNDSDRGVRKRADSAYSTLYNQLQRLEKSSTDSGWGSTSTESASSSTSSPSSMGSGEGEPRPALEYRIEETLNGKFTLTGELESESIQTSGLLKIKNLSSSERIFDINFNLDDKGLTNLEDDSFHFNEIQSEEEQSIEYDVNIEKVDDVAIEFKEAIDTFPDSEEDSNVLVFGQEMATKIKYTFKAKKTLKSFTLTKELPSGFQNVSVEESSIGNASLEGNSVVWKLEDVNEGLTGNLTISGLFKVENLDDISTGKASVEFSSVTDSFSGLKLSESKEGRVRSKHSVESNEIAEEPDYWLNRFTFENPSDVDVLLRQVKLTDPNSDEPNKELVSLSEPFLVSAGDQWASEEFKTFSESIPTFKKSIDMSVGTSLLVDTKSQLEVEQGALRVANITATKAYELSEVPSYRETPLPAEVNIENIGAIPYANLQIRDRIPEQFLPPLAEDMVLTLSCEGDEETLNPDSDYNYTVEGDSEDADSVKTVVINITREIPPECKVKWNYAPRAYKPLPDHTYDFQTDIEATLTERAPPLTFTLPEDLTITVVHKRRNVTVGKTILPGASKNEYKIELFYKNRGTADLETLSIRDFVPEGFSMGSEEVDFDAKDIEGNEYSANDEVRSEDGDASGIDMEGTMKVWTFSNVKPDDTIFIRYSISGEGEYSMRQAQMTFT